MDLSPWRRKLRLRGAIRFAVLALPCTWALALSPAAAFAQAAFDARTAIEASGAPSYSGMIGAREAPSLPPPPAAEKAQKKEGAPEGFLQLGGRPRAAAGTSSLSA